MLCSFSHIVGKRNRDPDPEWELCCPAREEPHSGKRKRLMIWNREIAEDCFESLPTNVSLWKLQFVHHTPREREPGHDSRIAYTRSQCPATVKSEVSIQIM